MGRELKRVPLDFNWPLNMPWKGYINPYHSQECSVCDGSGHNPETKQIADDWYDFAGTGRKWCYNITQDEVDALVEAGRLYDFTHHFVEGRGWIPIEPKPFVSAETVNIWSRRGLGHDAINRWICVEARARRLGVWGDCPVCNGDGVIWFNERVKELNENWWDNEKYEPPAGDGWQVWETVSEGSPVTPVFATAELLIDYLVESDGWQRDSAVRFVKAAWAPSLIVETADDEVTIKTPKEQ